MSKEPQDFPAKPPEEAFAEPVVASRSPYTRKSDQKLRRLALDIVEGTVFGSDQIPVEQRTQLLPIVFMPLAVAESGYFAWLKQFDICFLYEYMEKAGPRCVNGYPIFFSFYVLNRADTSRMSAYVRELLEQRNEFLRAEPEGSVSGDDKVSWSERVVHDEGSRPPDEGTGSGLRG